MTARFTPAIATTRRCLVASMLGAALGLTSLGAQTPPPAPTGEETIELPSFTVTSTQDKGYLAANSVSATRIATAIANLPFSVSTFNSQFMTDIQARDLTDIARYAAGVANGSRGFNAGDDGIMARGFQQYPVHDGFFEGGGSGGNVVVDSYNFERVEVVKGPASLLYGQINPGGTVNYITKKATDKAFADFNFQGGSYNFERATLDVNQPIGGNLFLRVNGMWENAFQNVVLSKSQSMGFDPTLTWKPTKNLTVTVNYSWFDRHETPPAAFNTVIEVATPASIVTSMQASQGYKAPSAALTNLFTVDAANGINDSADLGYGVMYPGLGRNFNASGANDYRNTDLETLTAEADATLGNHWVARAAFDYAWNRDTQYATGLNNAYVPPPGSLTWSGTAWATSTAWSALTTAQQQAQELAFAQSLIQSPYNALDGMPTIQPRRNRLIEDYGHSDSIEVDLAGSYDLSWVKVKPLMGAYYDASYEYIITRVQTPSSTNLGQSYWQPWDLDPVSEALDGLAVNRNTGRVNFTAEPGQTLASLTQLGFTTDEAVYGTVNASFFNDRLLSVAGIRYNRSNGLTQNLLPGAVYVPGVKGLHDLTPQVGVGYKIRRDLMVYASYSESYIVNGTSLNGGALDHAETRLQVYEDVLNRAMAAAGVLARTLSAQPCGETYALRASPTAAIRRAARKPRHADRAAAG